MSQKQTTRTEYIPTKPVVTPLPPAPTPLPPAPAVLPTPPLPPPAAEPAKPAAGSNTVSRQNSNTSSDNGSVAMRDHGNQRPAPGNRESNREPVGPTQELFLSNKVYFHFIMKKRIKIFQKYVLSFEHQQQSQNISIIFNKYIILCI